MDLGNPSTADESTSDGSVSKNSPRAVPWPRNSSGSLLSPASLVRAQANSSGPNSPTCLRSLASLRFLATLLMIRKARINRSIFSMRTYRNHTGLFAAVIARLISVVGTDVSKSGRSQPPM